ncbi:MAG: hypothetical protein ABSD57_02605 [Verrucomicrobiota bacterium]|jgi:hypothetical protein
MVWIKPDSKRIVAETERFGLNQAVQEEQLCSLKTVRAKSTEEGR